MLEKILLLVFKKCLQSSFLKSVIAFSFCSILLGCATYNEQNYENISPKDTSIVIPANDMDFNGYLGEIKQAFRQAGWKVYARPQTEQHTQGTEDKSVDLKTNTQFNTRYTLSYHWSANTADPAFENHTCWFAMNYSISIIDNTTDQEAFSISGVSCGEGIVEAMQTWLHTHPGT